MSFVDQPHARMPIGSFTINGRDVVSVELDPYWYRIFNALVKRVGGYSALTNVELSEQLLSIAAGEMVLQQGTFSLPAEMVTQQADAGHGFADVAQSAACDQLQEMVFQR